MLLVILQGLHHSPAAMYCMVPVMQCAPYNSCVSLGEFWGSVSSLHDVTMLDMKMFKSMIIIIATLYMT